MPPTETELLAQLAQAQGEDPYTPEAAAILLRLGALYLHADRLADAERALTGSLAIAQAVYGEPHPAVASALLNLAVVCTEQGRDADAEKYDRQAVLQFLRTLGLNHPDTRTAMDHWAQDLIALGQPPQPAIAQLLAEYEAP